MATNYNIAKNTVIDLDGVGFSIQIGTKEDNSKLIEARVVIPGYDPKATEWSEIYTPEERTALRALVKKAVLYRVNQLGGTPE